MVVTVGNFIPLVILLATGWAYDKEDMTCFHRVLQSENGGFSRELLPYASEVYSIKILPDGHFMDSSYCSYGRTYGHEGSYLWVDKGCRGRFKVCYKLGFNILLVCASIDDELHHCPADDKVVRIERVKYLVDSKDCIQEKTFGFKDDYVWVSGGCRAAFRVTVPHKENEGSRFQLLF